MTTKFSSVVLACLCALPFVGACRVVASPARTAARAEGFCYVSSDGRRVRSTVVRTQEPGGERLVGVTEIDGGAGGRLRQEVTLDATGAVRRAEAQLDAVGGRPAKRVVMDPVAGSVDITMSSTRIHWDVPTDFPWVWAPLLTSTASGGPMATPLDARVVWRAAAQGRAVRLLDLGTLASYGMTADQVAVADAKGGTVILADDAIDMEAGMPKRLHLAALGSEVEAVSADGATGTLVALARCISTKEIVAQ
jgi:hypothetical protein